MLVKQESKPKAKAKAKSKKESLDPKVNESKADYFNRVVPEFDKEISVHKTHMASVAEAQRRWDKPDRV